MGASPREGRWIARPARPRWAWGGMAAGFLIVVPNVVRDVLAPLIGRGGAWAAMIAALSLSLLPEIRGALARRVRPEDRALVDGGFGEQFLVELTIVAQGRRLGTDRGALWFADGLMGFSGRAASFVLAPGDLRVTHPGSPRQRGRDPLPQGSLALRGAPREAHLLVVPLGRERRRYRECLKSFMWSEGHPEGERTWPPLTPYGARRASVGPRP